MAPWSKKPDRDDRSAREIELLREEVGKTLREGLAELRTGAASERQELGTIVREGLRDNRGELAELRRTLGEVHKDVAETRREGFQLRLELEAERRAAEARAAAPLLAPVGNQEEEPGPGEQAAKDQSPVRPKEQAVPDATADDPGEQPAPGHTEGDVTTLVPDSFDWAAHVLTLRKAAGISATDLACHPHTWAFLVQQTARAGHFQLPALSASAGKDEKVKVALSGRSLIAVLNALRTTVVEETAGQDVETWALAATFYERIAEVVNATDGPTGRTSRRRALIDIDDQSEDLDDEPGDQSAPR